MRWRFILAVIFLPFLTLLLGLQLGIQLEENRLRQERAVLEQQFQPAGEGVSSAGDPEQTVDLSILWTVWRMLQNNYIDPQRLLVDAMRYGAVKGAVNAIEDPYTVFMTPEESQEFTQSLKGQLQGIGAELQFKDGAVVVVSPLKGSPAKEAGLLPKDVIVKVDSQDVLGKSLEAVVDMIRGPKGTEVTLTVFRASREKQFTFTIVREDIRVPSVETAWYETSEGNVALVSVNQFGEGIIAEVSEALSDIDAGSVEGVILDLRFNGGGFLDGAVGLTSLFLRDGKVVTVERKGEQPKAHYALGRPLVPEEPLVILINEGSASASEIVAGALQDAQRAVVMGAPSFGKGSVQEVIDIPGGSTLRVTVARWLTPSGRNIAKDGIEPNIAISMTAEDYEAGRDPQLEAAVRFLITGKEEALTGTGALRVEKVK
jgi:carboxyl-terminal processing protease